MSPRPQGGRLRIVHCVRAPIGGIFRHVLDLAAEQSARGHLVGIVIDSHSGGAFEDQKIAEAAPRLALGVTRLPMARSIRPDDLVSAWAVYRAVSRLLPDVLHGHGAKGGTFARLVGTLMSRSGRAVARIYTPHGGSLHFSPTTAAGRVVFGLERLMESACDAIIHVSRYEAGAYLDKIGRARCSVSIVANGLRPHEFARIKAAPGVADLVYMGMMRDLKGPDLLIRAVARLRQRGDAVPRLMMVGDGPDLPRYKALVESLGLSRHIHFSPPMPTRDGLALGRLLVVPSRAESMPYIVLEAAAAGVPMVATRVGGIPEILGSGARALVEPDDVDALADAIAGALADPSEAAESATATRRTLRERFTVGSMTDHVERIYRAALLRRRDPALSGRIAALQPAE